MVKGGYRPTPRDVAHERLLADLLKLYGEASSSTAKRSPEFVEYMERQRGLSAAK